MNKIIKIECDKTINVLVGFDAGRDVYEQQVKDQMIFNEPVIFIVQDNVRVIGSSFIQGFFEKIKEEMGIEGIEKYIEMKSNEVDFKNMVITNLL